MKKILIIETNIPKYDKYNRATGLWLGETAHFYDEIVSAGYEIDFASPMGGYVPLDPESFKYANEIDWKWYTDKDFRTLALANTKKISELNPQDYIAIYYTGGHGVLWDYPDNSELKKMAEEIYKLGGFIVSVCHGAVGLLNLTDENEKYLIKDKVITGFTNDEEKLNGTTDKVPFLTETELIQRGAKYEKESAFKEFVVKDGRIITGQNPQSPQKVGKILIEELNKLK
ncbi:type 1 glutamine amidotransferase domain-containing protein [Lactococcus lactis]